MEAPPPWMIESLVRSVPLGKEAGKPRGFLFNCSLKKSIPIGSMGLVYLPICIWLIFMVDVGKNTIHGSFGYINSI